MLPEFTIEAIESLNMSGNAFELPDDCWWRILSFLPPRLDYLLVCKRFQRICKSDHVARGWYRKWHVDANALTRRGVGKLALQQGFRSVVHLIEDLSLYEAFAAGPRLDLLPVLEAASAQAPLRALRLHVKQQRPEWAAILKLAALATGLQALSLASFATELPPDWLLPLSPLSQLRSLSWAGLMTNPPPPGFFRCFPLLTHLCFRPGFENPLPSFSWAGAGEGSGGGGSSGGSGRGPHLAALELCCVAIPPECCTQASLGRLASLHLHQCALPGLLRALLPQLPQLTRLCLTHDEGWPDLQSELGIMLSEQELAQLLTGCSRLVELQLESWGSLPELPPGALPCLTHLQLEGCSARGLLPRSWCALSTLQSLRVAMPSWEGDSDDDEDSSVPTTFVECPAEITALRALEEADFGMVAFKHGLPMLLTQLTSLTRLVVSQASGESKAAFFPERPRRAGGQEPFLPRLRVLRVVDDEGLQSLPKGINSWSAPTLEELDLGTCPNVRLQSADVARLAAMPRLLRLRLPSDVQAPAVLECLALAAPWLELEED